MPTLCEQNAQVLPNPPSETRRRGLCQDLEGPTGSPPWFPENPEVVAEDTGAVSFFCLGGSRMFLLSVLFGGGGAGLRYFFLKGGGGSDSF